MNSLARSTPTPAGILEFTPAASVGPQVLQVVLSLTPGGTERLVIELSKRLHAAHGMHVCCLDAPGAWAEELTARGISVTALGRRPGFSPAVGRQIARIAARHDATVLHCHQYSPFVYGTLARLWRPMDVVFTEHGRFSDEAPSVKRQIANRLLSRFPSRIFSVSNDLRTHLTGEGFPQRQVQVIHNGIHLGSPVGPDARSEARGRLGVEPHHVLIGSVARLDPVKDLRTMVRAFRDVLRALPQARLVIIGDGPERAAVAADVAELGLAAAVILTGHREDVASLLRGLDIYANSSIFEGVSLTILEAMAAGLPVVATRVGGTPEVVVDGETGRLVPARDVRAMAEALLAIATNPETAGRMAAGGRSRVERQFTIERMVERYAAVYRETGGR